MKRFLSDPDRGRHKPQLFSSDLDDGEVPSAIIEPQPSYIDLERHADEGAGSLSKKGKGRPEDVGRMVDVVLSDMSAPWEQTTGFWKRSLSDPYFRMMNTSGINFKDHAGSMVCLTPAELSTVLWG